MDETEKTENNVSAQVLARIACKLCKMHFLVSEGSTGVQEDVSHVHWKKDYLGAIASSK